MKNHEDEKLEHLCSYCSKKCKNTKYLKRHIVTVHLAEWKFKCNYCEKTFKRERNLTVSHFCFFLIYEAILLLSFVF